MNTHKAEYESAIDRLQADLAKREIRMILAVIGAIGVATAILSVVIQASGS